MRTPQARLLGALLCAGVVVVHVLDQGGVTAFTPPDWLGWAYRVLEVGAVLVGLALLAGVAPRLVWTVALLVGLVPLVAYLLSRTVGLPRDPADEGHWRDPVGTASLVIEAALVVVAVVAFRRPRRSRYGSSYARYR